MKLPLSWLNKYIDCGLTPQQISKALTLAGLEVESIETLSCGFDKVVVGHVLQTEKHPNADKLTVAKVTDGNATYQVVCGALNCRPGLKTAFALVGATLRDKSGASFQVKKVTLRGVESNGMLCSEKELNFGDNHEGIIELSDELKVGTDLASLYEDTVFDISLTPNLGHCASVLGIARELSAATGCSMSLSPPSPSIQNGKIPSEKIAVFLEEPKECSRYACRIVENVKVGPSPEWLQRLLNLAGVRPINNIVDATNFVLLELGHPLHAFDYDKIRGKKIVVRKAKDNQVFITLDGKERILNNEDIVIADAEKPLALAGIMGGQNSEVTASTSSVLLEAAYFRPATIRKTSKRLGLMTDASKRFERGTDPNQLVASLDAAVALIQKIAGGEPLAELIDAKIEAFKEKQIVCRLSRINELLGTSLSLNEVENIFTRLRMSYSINNQDQINVIVPTYRVDISQEIDLIEEVARIYGFENIPKKPSRYHSSVMPHSPLFTFEREIRVRLMAEQLQELITCDLIGPTLLAVVKEDPMPSDSIVRVLNPTSIEQSILRTSLLPGLLQVVKYNFDHQNRDIHGFELGRIHFKEGERYREQSVVGIVLTGNRFPPHWSRKSEEVDFFDLKGIVENLFCELNISNVSYKNEGLKTFHDGRQASIYVGDLEVGSLGEIHPSIQRDLDISRRILFCEMNLQDLIQVRREDLRMRKPAVYPGSERDWTITLKEEDSLQEFMNRLKAISSSLLEEVMIMDIYRSEKLGFGLKNVTFHFVYRDQTKTIDQETVEAEHRRIIEHLYRT